MISLLTPSVVHAVNDEASAKENRKAVESKRIDELSLVAYISTVAGIASFFLAPVASLILMPAGFLMGMITLFGNEKRYEKRRGRGLALAAVAVGGAYTLVVFGSLLAFAIFGF